VTASLVFRGRCWKFGDDIAIDGDIMPLEMALARETRPEVLAPHVMAGVAPGFHKKVSAGDIIVAGKRFAQGNPHIQGLIGIAGLKLGLVAESIPRGSFRNAITCGLAMLPAAAGVTAEADDGDRLEVDFETGLFRNFTRGTERRYEPLDPLLLDIVRAGGSRPVLLARIARMHGTPHEGA
jgi:3-isopropylmalate/(R)-2-methylmalate dehydratase small subunit